MIRALLLGLLLFPAAALAGDFDTGGYGDGLLCPKAETQVTFYTEGNQQEAAGTIAYDTGAGFIVTSTSFKDIKSSGARTVDSLCEGNAPGLRIDSKRDGWLQAGKLWFPPTQEWDYGDWVDYLRKTSIWKPLGALKLFPGTPDAPDKGNPYGKITGFGRVEIYPVKFSDDGNFALVVLDESGAYARCSAGHATPPHGSLGWIPLYTEGGQPMAVPIHAKPCTVEQPVPIDWRAPEVPNPDGNDGNQTGNR